MIKKGFFHIGIFFLFLLSLLPLTILNFLARILYLVIYKIAGYRKKVVRRNLINSFPEKSPAEILLIEKTFFKYLARLIVEIVKMSTISQAELGKRVQFHHLDLIEAYLKKGQSVLACSGHYGNWEWSTLAFGLHVKEGKYVIYKPLGNEVFENWFKKIRTRYGNVLVAMRQTLRTVVATKAEPTVFCFASDQTPVREEIQYTLNFMHQPTPVLLGLEKIALQTNRPVFYFDIVVKKDGYDVICMPLCTNPQATTGHEITDRFFEYLTRSINRAPAYWLWSHRRWKLNG